MEGGVSEVGNPEWRGGGQFWKSGRKEGTKKCAFRRGGVDFSLNNPFAYFLKYSQVFASKLPITPTFQG